MTGLLMTPTVVNGNLMNTIAIDDDEVAGTRFRVIACCPMGMAKLNTEFNTLEGDALVVFAVPALLYMSLCRKDS